MKTLAALFIVFVMLTGCGQTGDLYWPEDEKTVVDEDEDAA